jgi:hypothetical protein
MSVLGRLKSLLGFGEENQNEISPFQDAGMTPDGTTGTETVDVISQNQTLPEDVVNNSPPSNPVPVPNTPPPQYATHGIVSGGGSPFVNVLNNQVVTTLNDKGQQSKSLQDLIEIGGSGFDDEVYARKLRRQASMPDLKNEDYYPNEPFTESRTAWGDPIFSGAGAQFPMAAYDAQRKARAQAELDEAKRDIMQLKIPEIKTGAYYNSIRSGFTQQVKDIVNDAATRAGGNYQKIKRILDQEGKLALAQSEWQGVAKMIDEKADAATSYLKKVRESPGDLYFPFEGVTATTDFLNGMNEFANGRITPAQLNELDKRMVSADKWEKFKQENMAKLKPTDYIPTPEQLKNITPEDRAAFKAAEQESLRLKGAAPDFKKWIFEKKYSEVALPQVMSGIVEPFFDQNKTAAEQLVLPGESVDSAKKRVANGIAALFGKQIEVGEATQNQRGKGISIKTGGGKQPEKTFYQSIQERIHDIRTQISNINPSNESEAKQNAEQIFGGGTADDLIFGVRAFDWPTINQSISSMPYNELYEPNASDFKTKKTVYFDKVNTLLAGIPSDQTTAKNLKVQGVINGFAVKGKDGQYRVFSNKDAIDSPLTADYKPYLIQVVTDQRYEDGTDVDAMDFPTLMANKTKAPKSGIFFRFIPFDRSTATTFDKVADKSSAGTGGTESIEVEGEVKEDF